MLEALTSRIVFRPSQEAIECGKERRLLASGGRRIETWVERTGGDEPQVFVLRFLGARGRAENGTTDPLNRLPALAGEVWIANPPGFGGSSGPTRLRYYADDALAVFDALHAVAAGRPLWVLGQSVGTLAALHVAANRPVDWLILRNVTPVPELVAARWPWLRGLAPRVAAAFPRCLDAAANAARCRGRALFVTSARDRTAPPAAQARILAAYAGPARQLVVDCAHADHVLPPFDEMRYRDEVLAEAGRIDATPG